LAARSRLAYPIICLSNGLVAVGTYCVFLDRYYAQKPKSKNLKAATHSIPRS